MPLAGAEPWDDRAAFYARIRRHNLAPLPEILGVRLPPHPAPVCLPALWRYRDVRRDVLETARLIAAPDAERRMLALENPGLRGASSITHGLLAGLQTLLPGEVASRHRHTQWALRVVVEGEGAYTAQRGERTVLHPGDCLIMPPWSLHDFGNAGDAPVVWLEGMDMPTVEVISGALAENHPPNPRDPSAPAHAPSALTAHARGSPDAGDAAPGVAYRYGRTRKAVASLRGKSPPHPSHGYRMQCAAPACADSTIGVFLELLPAGFRGRPYRSTDGTVYCVVEGRGSSRVGDATFAWEPHDVFVVPSWCAAMHETPGDAVLLAYSDRPAQQALRLWREEALD